MVLDSIWQLVITVINTRSVREISTVADNVLMKNSQRRRFESCPASSECEQVQVADRKSETQNQTLPLAFYAYIKQLVLRSVASRHSGVHHYAFPELEAGYGASI